MGAATASHVPDSYLNRLLQEVGNNTPDFIKCIGGVIERDLIKIDGLIREVNSVEVDRRIFHEWLNPWAAKQAIVFWYRHTGKILPPTGGVFVHWIPNASIENHTGFFETVGKMNLPQDTVRQGKYSYEKQFRYLYGVAADKTFATFAFSYHESAALWCGVFEDLEKVKKKFASLPIFVTSPDSGIRSYSYPIGE